MRRRDLPLALAAGFLAARPALAQEDLLRRLREGGLVMLMRHARTVPGVADPPGFRFDDCATQRNLDEAGRAQARAVGARLRAERVPVGRVLTSRWCRCRETAELLDLGPVEPFAPLDSFFGAPGRRASQRAGIVAFARGWAGPGNAMLVTHQVNVTAVIDAFPLPGEIVVVTAGPELAPVGRLKLA
jgi:phosphohistidine phosphatase SixA